MYRFTSESNREAQTFFHRAIALDPTFSRSYAGLSFTHFQNAFVLKTREREQEIALALNTAGQGLEADPSDPAAHWAMGRALWLRRDQQGAITALDQATRLSPSYASAHYSLAMVHCQIGDPARAVEAADTAALLSPLDPMLFAIFGARTFGLLRLGKTEEAAVFALRGAEQPNAHIHARAIAVLTLATAGRMDEADAEWTRLRHLQPAYNFRQFEDAFHLVDDLKRIYQKAAKAMQMPH
jgi:tetratricopeptide (TPR) repeat protein